MSRAFFSVLVLLALSLAVLPAIPSGTPVWNTSDLRTSIGHIPVHRSIPGPSDTHFSTLTRSALPLAGGQNCTGGGFVGNYELALNETGISNLSNLVGGWDAILNETGPNSFGSSGMGYLGKTVCEYVQNGTYTFWVVPIPGWSANPSRGSITIAGFDVFRIISFRPTFAVHFIETGLPSGTNWTVTLGGVVHNATGPTVGYYRPNGNYSFSVDPLAGYAPISPYGTITVNGSNVTQTITFGRTQNLVFQEAGLPFGTAWSVTVNGTTSNSSSSMIVIPEVNGTYDYSISQIPGYAVYPNSSSITITGQSEAIAITYRPIVPAVVEFYESGLGAAAFWSVTLGGSSRTSSGTEIYFRDYNGSYGFQVAPVFGFAASPTSGSVIVQGVSQNVTVQFIPRVYSVEFDATGLPPGIIWQVELGTTVNSAAVGTIGFLEGNGTFSFNVEASDPLWQAAIPTGALSVNGVDLVVKVSFLFSYRFSVEESGLPVGSEWYVNLSGTPTLHPAFHRLIAGGQAASSFVSVVWRDI